MGKEGRFYSAFLVLVSLNAMSFGMWVCKMQFQFQATDHKNKPWNEVYFLR